MSYTPTQVRYALQDQPAIPDGTYVGLDNSQIMQVTHAYGYQVAYTDTRKPRSAYIANSPEQVRDIIARLLREGYATTGYIGIWTDDHGTYVEPSYWVEHEFPARELGQAWQQYSIWDWSDDSEVVL
jgi:hypothetical protein